MKKMILALMLGLSTITAYAQIIVPNTLVAGNVIRAADLNTNFSTLGNHALDRITGGNIQGNITLDPGITVDGVDIGATICSTCTVTFKDMTLASPSTGLTVAGVNIINSSGKIPAISSTYFTSVSLDAANLASGNIPAARNTLYTEFDNGNSGTSKAVNFLSNGPVQKVTRNGNCTYTLTAPSSAGTVVLKFIHEASATAYTVAFSPTVKFPGGVAPTFTNTSGAIDIVTFYWDGTTWFAVQTANFS